MKKVGLVAFGVWTVGAVAIWTGLSVQERLANGKWSILEDWDAKAAVSALWPITVPSLNFPQLRWEIEQRAKASA